MLSRISIQNLVIVRQLDLPLRTGMTAMTGETGAGKSILIDALGLALGDKSDNSMIRAGTEKAEVTVAFDLDINSPVHAWLDAHDLAAEGDCLLRRVLVRDGRSRAYINGTPSPQNLLRELAEMLVDIHGQHAHQSLLRPTMQRELLDDYAGLREQVRKLGALYTDWRNARDAFAQLRQSSVDRANRIDYLRFQIEELDSLPCDADDQQSLEQEHARLANAERLLQEGGAVLNLLDDEEPSIRQSLAQSAHTLDELRRVDEALAASCELLESAAIQVDEAASTLRHYLEGVELDPQRLHEIDEQLRRLHDAARKHHVSPAELGALLQQLRDELDGLDNADARLVELERATEQAQRDYLAAAEKLSKARQTAARRLSNTVSDSMQLLGMSGGRFRVACQLQADEPAAHGIDRIAFLVAANPGQPEGALSDVASGGELSRISLAIQVATANCGSVPTLIFDEVDVGIGGAVAEIVGQLLRRLGQERQVVSVTHLPQVASQAHNHLRVHKMTDGKTTETRIDVLDQTARVDETARMLGGIDITEQTRRHAAEMIDRAQNTA